MGSNSSSGGGRTDGGQMNSTTAYKAGVGNINEKGKKTASYKSDNPDAFRNVGAEKIKKTVSKFPTPAMLIASKPLQAGSKVTRDFFTDKVLGSKNYKGTTKEKFSAMSRSAQESMYQSYIGGRTSGSTDAYGNTISQGGNDNNGNQVVQAPTVTGPTTAEVSQVASVPEVTAEEARASANELIRKKRRGRGRSLMIATSSQGAKDEGLTLSSKTLLG
jgi:hypothetical protein